MSDGYQNLQHSEFCCKARQVRLLTNMGLFVYPVLPPSPLLLSAAAFRNLPPAFAFPLFLAASTAVDRESGLSQRAKEGLLLAQLSDLQRHMTRPEWLLCAKNRLTPACLTREITLRINHNIHYPPWLFGMLVLQTL